MKKEISKIKAPKYEDVLSRVKQARIEAGMSQEYVAEALGKYASYISKIEHGDRKIDVIELVELAQLYGKPLKYFLFQD